MSVEITVTPNYDRWVQGFDRLAAEVQAQAVDELRVAAEVFYSNTQDVVHVITGNLRASGHVEVEEEKGGTVVARLAYDADYAMAEHARGGSHAYLTRGWEATESDFREAITATWDRTVESWR